MKAYKRPVEIEYLPFTRENHNAILAWGTKERPINIVTPRTPDGKAEARITTLEGVMTAVEERDVIIRGVNGEVYPCKVDIFEKTYDTEQVKTRSLEQYRNLILLLAAVVWHLNNVKDGEPTTKMGIPNAVYEVCGKKIAQLPKDRYLTESEALEIARKK